MGGVGVGEGDEPRGRYKEGREEKDEKGKIINLTN